MYTVNSRRDPARAKHRNMSRSVLPSTRRLQAAKDLAIVRRSGRRARARCLARLIGLNTSQLLDELDRIDFDHLELRQTRDVRDVVRERRYADKVAPLTRWAIGSTKDVRPEDRLSRLATTLPKNLIGAHAMSHLELRRDLNPTRSLCHCWICSHNSPDLAAERERLRSVLHVILGSGLHRGFNRLLVAHADGARDFRPLEGSHDVEAFINELYVTRLARFPRQATDAHGAVLAALGRLGLTHLVAVQT